MSDDDPDLETVTADMQAKMPQPPDVESLVEQQQKNLQALYQASEEMYKAYPSRDLTRSVLSTTLGVEINSVFAIAAAVHTPVQALASIPLVLAAANVAFATVPVAEASIVAKTGAAQAQFSKDMQPPDTE